MRSLHNALKLPSHAFLSLYLCFISFLAISLPLSCVNRFFYHSRTTVSSSSVVKMATEHNAQSRANANGDPLEKDFSNTGYTNGNTYHLNDTNMDNDTALRRIRTAGSISISPELFEKIYLSPQNAVKGDLRKTFGNPTPLYVYPNARLYNY